MGALNLRPQPLSVASVAAAARATPGPLELAGFRLMRSEWDEFDEDSQAEILHLLGAAKATDLAISPGTDDAPYHSYILTFG